MSNLLKNSEFAGGTYQPKGEMSLVLPNDWIVGCLDKGVSLSYDKPGVTKLGTFNKLGPRARPNMTECLKPEILVITPVVPYLDPPRTDGSGNAVTMFKLYGTIAGWLAQVVPVTPGETYRVRARAHAWARDGADPNDAHFSHGIGKGPYYAEEGTAGLNDSQINFRFRVGIDPFGATNPHGGAVVWGKGGHIYNVFHDVPPVEAVARAESICVFLYVDNLWGLVNSNSFWAHPVLEEVVVPPPPPPPSSSGKWTITLAMTGTVTLEAGVPTIELGKPEIKLVEVGPLPSSRTDG